uniref:Uncharacterized protein n=1 Tax=Lepeophtheirus salmonis TaxID=72036 RepID=A0A0K2ULW0_LEPSM
MCYCFVDRLFALFLTNSLTDKKCRILKLKKKKPYRSNFL